jgi:capsular polysaccharide export protein
MNITWWAGRLPHDRRYFAHIIQWLKQQGYAHHRMMSWRLRCCIKGIIGTLFYRWNAPINVADMIIFKKKRFQKKYPYGHKSMVVWYGWLVRYWYHYYRSYEQHYTLTTVCLWNGFDISQRVLQQVIKQKGGTVWYFENGTLPDTTAMDAAGINADNSFPRHIKLFTPTAYPVKTCHTYVLVPFQVELDTQILYYSPWIVNMRQFYVVLETMVKSLNVQFLIKLHPKERDPYHDLRQKNNAAITFTTEPITPLIKASCAVLTVNSSVGMEALSYGKPVLVCGRACYDSIAIPTTHDAMLYHALKHLSAWTPNYAAIHHYMHYLRHHGLLPGNWRQPHEAHYQAILKKLTQ